MGDKASEAPKKMKFAPKIAPRKNQRLVEAKREASKDEDSLNEALLKRAKEKFARSRQNIDKKLGTEQVASFGPSFARTYARSFGTSSDSSSSKHQHPFTDGRNESSVPRLEKEYVDPWDYYSYYPTVLPLRRPHSGNPGMFWRHFSIHVFYSSNSSSYSLSCQSGVFSIARWVNAVLSWKPTILLSCEECTVQEF